MSLMTPHDCFACFNRLPNNRYSIFQYTTEERNRFREHQFGQGAVDRFEKMLRKEQSKRWAKVEDDRHTIVKGREGQSD